MLLVFEQLVTSLVLTFLIELINPLYLVTIFAPELLFTRFPLLVFQRLCVVLLRELLFKLGLGLFEIGGSYVEGIDLILLLLECRSRLLFNSLQLLLELPGLGHLLINSTLMLILQVFELGSVGGFNGSYQCVVADLDLFLVSNSMIP